MRRKTFISAVRVIALLSFVSGACVLAQEPKLTASNFSGLINDYSPGTVKGGPWEMHGQWSLNLRKDGGTELAGYFSAQMTMSDYGTSAGVVDPTQAGQNAHTHHIKLTNATVTWNMDGCPVFSPATTKGFQVNGTVSLMTGNGSNALFESTPPSTTLQVCVTGGTEVSNSNVTLVFVGPATTHFGTQAIHGVVLKVD
jgi:hypothetical protein